MNISLRRPRSRKSGGFTLIEVLLVTIMLVLVFFPLLQVLMIGITVSEQVKGSNTAVMLAQQKLEDIRNTPFGNIAPVAPFAVPGYPSYTMKVDMIHPPNTDSKLDDVTVTVSWGNGPKAESIYIETLISNF
jgi:Tfp pilus assembly protein PilV